MRDWKQYTYTTLNDLNLRARKSQGQNFLIRYRVVDQIVAAADILPGDHVLEIGGGVGILTHALAKTGVAITVIEKEKKLADHLREIYKDFQDVTIIQDDALRCEWPPYIKVVANLPYSISSQIIDRIVHHTVEDATIMLQREVGLRCLTRPGSRDYSRLAVLCEIHGFTQRIMDVAPESFFPSPKVSSIVIQFTKADKSWENEHNEIEELAKNLFSVKRRTLRKVIRRFLRRREVHDDAWEQCPHKTKRIFELSVQDLDEVLSHLKINATWPLAGEV